jgi:hypothetical protein
MPLRDLRRAAPAPRRAGAHDRPEVMFVEGRSEIND